MPRATWKGFLRLSLVSCPIYLSPATTRAKPIRLHQVWVPPAENFDQDEPLSVARSAAADEQIEAERSAPTTRVALRPHDPQTGEEIEREDVLKGYEYERGRFVTLTKEELKALDIESSRIVDLDTFVPRADVDPVYFDTPYYVYPEGPVAAEAFRVSARRW